MGTLDNVFPLGAADLVSASRLFLRATRQHMHLDWHTLDEWLASPKLRCWVARRNGSVEALLGATLQRAGDELISTRDGVAWLRLAVPGRAFGLDPMLDRLWEVLREGMLNEAVRQMGLLAMDGWIESHATRWGFAQTNAVVTLRHEGQATRLPDSNPSGLRSATRRDLDNIVRVDTAAFEPLWRYHQSILEAAVRQAAMLKVIERDGQIAGYQLSTHHSGTGHLARLAVLPEWQGRGLGSILVADMLCQFATHGITTVTVNTQEDNHRSRRLYARLGFAPAHHRVPVWTLEM